MRTPSLTLLELKTHLKRNFKKYDTRVVPFFTISKTSISPPRKLGSLRIRAHTKTIQDDGVVP